MLKNRLMTSVLTVLIACAALSCAPDSRTDSLLGPDQTEAGDLQHQTSDAQDSAQFDSAEGGSFTPLNASELQAQGYTLITEPAQTTKTRTLLGWLVKTVEATLAKLLGIDGGVLALLDHVLSVPQGAVTEPTIFSMTVIQSGYVEVELTATPKSLLSTLFFWRKVEEVQFNVPVELSLSYARATNVTDPSRLKIMRVKADGNHEILPSTVDPVNRTVTAELDHFSRYCMIAN
jgi:hypothetical protein